MNFGCLEGPGLAKERILYIQVRGFQNDITYYGPCAVGVEKISIVVSVLPPPKDAEHRSLPSDPEDTKIGPQPSERFLTKRVAVEDLVSERIPNCS